MEVMKLWFQSGTVFALVAFSLLGIGIGIVLRKTLPKAKLLALFVPMFVYM